MTQTKMQTLTDEINHLLEQENNLRKKANEIGLRCAELRAKESALIYEAKQIETRRYELALEYNRVKKPCPQILLSAEKALGRKLTIDEIFEIERIYAEKTQRNRSDAH